MTKARSFIYFLSFLAALLALKFLVIDSVFSTLPNDSEIWFASGLLLIILGVFITEKYFTKSLDVIVNAVTVLIVLWTLDNQNLFRLYPALIGYISIVGLLAVISFVLSNDNKDPAAASQNIARFLNRIATFFGSSKILFSIVFILSIFNYFVFSLQNSNDISNEQISILFLIIFWGMVLLVEPIDKFAIEPILKMFGRPHPDIFVGKIVKRFSPNMLIVEQSIDGHTPAFGQLARINTRSSSTSDDRPLAMCFGQMEADSKRYLQLYLLSGDFGSIQEQLYVNLITPEEQAALADHLRDYQIYSNRDNFIGFIYANSNIDVVKIKMIEGIDSKKGLKEGDLLSADFYEGSTKYQIISVETEVESIDGSSRKGYKLITAQQIGHWEGAKQRFIHSNWVPSINTPVFIETEEKEWPELAGNYFRVGVVPRSLYPIYIDLHDALDHHIAIIGKTGTGKSRMAAKMLQILAHNGVKVVILELDRNNKQSLTKYIPPDLIHEQKSDEFDVAKSTKNIITVSWQDQDISNSSGTKSLTTAAESIINRVIQFQSANQSQKLCIAMEEAYDFIPESTFGNQGYGQPGVSRVSQLVLKCRKHGIGFVVITQRTALVTKTILYQCHTIIALQSFDETSKTFMSSYISSKYLDTMSILPRFRSIVVGKGSTCDKPVIVDFYDKSLANDDGVMD